MTTYEKILTTVNRLFIYTDTREWDKLQQEVFCNKVHYDMASMGGGISDTTAVNICKIWEEGFTGVDAVNHLAGNYIVTRKNRKASVFAYATATHYKDSAKKGKTREFIGSYELLLVKKIRGWRIDSFKYHLKFATGNLELV